MRVLCNLTLHSQDIIFIQPKMPSQNLQRFQIQMPHTHKKMGANPSLPCAPHLIPLLGAQEVPGHVLGQHVGDKGLVPAPHLIDPLLLVMDIDLPEEEGPGQLLHLWVGGDGCTPQFPPTSGVLSSAGSILAAVGPVWGWGQPGERLWDKVKP